MIKLIFFFCFLLPNVFVFSQNETQAIQDVFKNFQSAIKADRESEAMGYMDSHTLNYYKSLLSNVRSADSLTLNSLSVLDKYTILNIRIVASRKEILAFDDKSFIGYVIKNGMTGKNTLDGVTLGKITIKDKSAKAMIIEDGEKSSKFYNFYSDGKQWKIDFSSIFPAEEKDTEDLIKRSGKAENEFIIGMLELMTDKKPGPNIWKKIK